jgi:hypothetical protein
MNEENQSAEPKKSWFARHKIITTVGVIVIVLIGLSALGGAIEEPTATNNNNDSQQESTVVQEEVVEVTAVELSQAYDDNKVAADAKYEDKTLQISGVIDDIGKDILDAPYVTLKGRETSFFGVQCMFSRNDEALLANLSKGQQLTLQGKLSGELIGNVLVRGCTIID